MLTAVRLKLAKALFWPGRKEGGKDAEGRFERLNLVERINIERPDMASRALLLFFVDGCSRPFHSKFAGETIKMTFLTGRADHELKTTKAIIKAERMRLG